MEEKFQYFDLLLCDVFPKYKDGSIKITRFSRYTICIFVTNYCLASKIEFDYISVML